jgi:methylaspartate mutase epsilon subunit
MEIQDRMWDEEEFARTRKEVLAQWPTGKEVDLAEAVEYHRRLPPEKNFALAVRKGKEEGRTLTQPRGGVPLVEWQIELLRCLQDEGGADLLPITTDTYTRNLRLSEAQKGLEESRQQGRAMLNGLPIVNHGVRAVRRIVDAVARPIMVLSGTVYPRITAEVGLSAGCTGFLGAGISYTLSYTRNVPLEDGIRNYQYLDRLVKYYNDHGVHIHREQPGFLTGTLIPPGLGIAIGVLEMLLAARQGLRHYTVGLCQNLDLIQDVAALRALDEVSREYLDRFGYQDFFYTVASHHWMQAFPEDEAQAFAIIAMGSAIAILGGATQMITKTTHEACGIPTKEANAQALRTCGQIVHMLRNRRLPMDKEALQEKEMIIREARVLLDRALEMGEGDFARAAIRGFQAGILDVPWAPSTYAHGKVITARDTAGAIRYVSIGNLPLNAELREYHRGKLEQRKRKEPELRDYEMAMYDITEMSRPVVGAASKTA